MHRSPPVTKPSAAPSTLNERPSVYPSHHDEDHPMLRTGHAISESTVWSNGDGVRAANGDDTLPGVTSRGGVGKLSCS